MNVSIEEPKVIKEESSHSDYRTTHPAYGQISCRSSGKTCIGTGV